MTSEVVQSLEMTEPSNAPYSEVTGPSDVPHSSEVTDPSPSSERILSSQALNSKEKTYAGTIDPNTCCMCLVPLKTMSVMEMELYGYHAIVEEGLRIRLCSK